MKTFITLSLALSLAACGGGGSSPAQTPITIPPINVVVPPIGDKPAKPYAGAFMAVEGQSVGYVAGTSPKDSVTRLMNIVIADPVTYAPMYKLLISDSGLKVTVFGEAIGTSAINGSTLYAPDMQFVVKLTVSGLVVVQL